MIRVNLAKTHNYTSAGTQANVVMDAAMATGGPPPAVKVLAMLIMTILLYGYQTYNLGLLNVELRKEQAEADRIQKKVTEFGSVRSVVQDLLKEKERLNKQLEVIQKISKKRAYKLKAINQVQKGMTDDLWLESLSVDANQIEFKGISRNASAVQDIVANLVRSDFIESAENREIKRVVKDNENFNSFDILVKVKN